MVKRYFNITCGADFTGTDIDKYVCFSDNWTNEDIDNYAYELRETLADSVIEEINEDDFDMEEDYDEAVAFVLDNFYNESWYNIKEISKKEWEDSHYGMTIIKSKGEKRNEKKLF